MILEEATLEAFEYEVWELSFESEKPILAACELCGDFKVTSKHDYHYLCLSCSLIDNKCAFGKKRTKEVREKLSNMHKGKTASEGTKACMSKAHTGIRNSMFGKMGEKNPNYKGGAKERSRRYRKTEKGKINIRKRSIKRRRHLEYTLLLPLAEGEVGHHITNEYVIGIPEEVHKKLSGFNRKKHRTKVLQWLKANDTRKYNLVLCALAKEHLKN